ncbi:NPCBM/NEW2 domain-containing protein [bacterium]|nr:NPCBM/NEW2 domain-containing protein [bacterium]
MRNAVFLVVVACSSQTWAGTLRLDLRTRDRKTGGAVCETVRIDTKAIGLVLVDPWNFHWCMTAAARVGAMAPRWNRALECARQLGMTVLFAPTDVASQYVGTPPRERALATPYLDVPKVRDLSCRFTCRVGPCMCGPGIRCLVNYGWDGIHPGLVIADQDYIVSGLREMYSVCKRRGLTHLIYTGLHTNMCLFGKPPALRNLFATGFECYVARDLNDAFTHYDPRRGFTPCHGTAQTDDDLERAGIPTINLVETMRKAGVWDDRWIVETVRITPWGTLERPHQFLDAVTVTLHAPWLENVATRYTLDGSKPTSRSPRYEKPLALTKTTTLRAAAFRGRDRLSLISDAVFTRLGAVPPLPEVCLDELTPVPRQYGHRMWFWHPKANQSFEGKPLRIRGVRYRKGLGMRAPANLRYELRPEFERFVAVAGVDDHLLDEHHGRFLAMHASVVFKVFVDGERVAGSPVMRISQEPWRFDVRIPAGSRRLSLVVTDAGSRSPYDLANWAEAGFILKGSAGRLPTLRVPGYWDRGGPHPHHDGFAWYRCFVVVPGAWRGKGLTVMVPAVDNTHEIYFNGQKVGGAGTMPPNYANGLDTEKPCTVPARLVRPGRPNLLAIRVFDAGGAGGFRDGAPALSLGRETITLSGRWLFNLGDKAEWATWPDGTDVPKYVTFGRDK